MVRTVASRTIGGKVTRKSSVTNSKTGGSISSDKSGGGNPVCPRETPSWQKPISNFLTLSFKNETSKTSKSEPVVDLEQPSTSKAEFVRQSPVDVVVEVDVHSTEDSDTSDDENMDEASNIVQNGETNNNELLQSKEEENGKHGRDDEDDEA